jgi:hypothetical protein
MEVSLMPVSMTVSWPASKHANPILYQLQYRQLGATVWINARAHAGPAVLQTVTGLQPGTNYEFRHVASVTAWSEISVATTLRAGVAPGAPTQLKVTN